MGFSSFFGRGQGGCSPCGTGYPCRCGARRGAAPLAALARPAPGERTISNAEVPLPRSPLSLAAGSVHQYRVLTAAPHRRVPLTPAEPATQGHAPRRARGSPPFPSAARVQVQGCKGRSPLHKNNLKSPPSRREGGRGDRGQKSKLKAGAGRRRRRHPPPQTISKWGLIFRKNYGIL